MRSIARAIRSMLNRPTQGIPPSAPRHYQSYGKTQILTHNVAFLFLAISPLILSGCLGSRKIVKQDQSYSIAFQRQDKTSLEKPRVYKWNDKEFNVVSDNYVKGEIKGISTIDDLSKLKGMIETLKFAVMQHEVENSSAPAKPAN